MWETRVRSLGQEDPLEKEMATLSRTLAWRIPWTEEPGGLQSTVSKSRTQLSDFTHSLYTVPLFHYKPKVFCNLKMKTHQCPSLVFLLLCSVTKSCLTLCDPMDHSPPGSCIRGILQTRTLDWVAISFSRASSQPRDRTRVSHIAGRLFTI